MKPLLKLYVLNKALDQHSFFCQFLIIKTRLHNVELLHKMSAYNCTGKWQTKVITNLVLGVPAVLSSTRRKCSENLQRVPFYRKFFYHFQTWRIFCGLPNILLMFFCTALLIGFQRTNGDFLRYLWFFF